jgi:hypothetical protein
MIRSKKHGYESGRLGFHQNTMTLHTRESRHMKFRVDTWQTWQSTDKDLRSCDPNTFCLDSWVSCTLHDHPSSFPTVWSGHLTPRRYIQKTKEFVGVPRVSRYFTTENSKDMVHRHRSKRNLKFRSREWLRRGLINKNKSIQFTSEVR